MMTTLLATAAPPPAATTDSAMSGFGSVGPNPLRVLQNAMDGRLDILNHPDQYLGALSDIHIVWASILMILGGLCVVNGLRWHKTVVVLLAGLLGVWAGFYVGDRIGGAHAVSSASLALLFAVVAFPGLRFAVALFGGLAGAFVGANVWTALNYAPDQHHFGAIMGLIIFGMLAFMVFRTVIVLFTSIGGAAILVSGAIAAMLKVEAWNGAISDALTTNHLVIPLVVAVAALLGVIIQQGGGMRSLYASADKAGAKANAKAA